MPLSNENIECGNVNVLAEKEAAYETAELNLIKAALKRTHMERFLFATKLYKIQQTLKKATYTHQPFKPSK